MKSSTNRGGHNANPLFSAFLKALLSVMLLLVGNVAVKAQTESSDFTFEDGRCYSKWVINSRIGQFWANTTEMGFATFDENGAIKKARNDGEKTKLDYVPGLVAKGVIEAAQYYSQYPWAKPWFLSIADFGDKWYQKLPGGGTPSDTEGEGGGSLDDINGFKLYITLYELAKDGGAFADANIQSHAQTAINNAIKGLKDHNDNYSIQTGTLAGDAAVGGWWHKKAYNNQMWLDGQYMGPALLAQIINYNNKTNNVSDDDWETIINQLDIVWNQCWNSTDGLLYHAFEANGGTRTSSSHADLWEGLSSTNFHSASYWGRACGWYFLALVDILHEMDKANLSSNPTYSDDYTRIKGYLTSLAARLQKKQDNNTGGWYQILDKDKTFYASEYDNGQSHTKTYNYIESSATAIFAAAYLKAIRLGYLSEADYGETATNAYKCIVNNFFAKDGSDGVNIFGSCRSAGLGSDKTDGTAIAGEKNFRDGSNAYYLLGSDVTRVAKSKNETEGKVLGAFILAATEYERLHTTLVEDLPATSTVGTALKLGLSGIGTANDELSYKWYKNGDTTPVAETAEYAPTEAGTYKCEVLVKPNSISRADNSYTITSKEVTVSATIEEPTPSTGESQICNFTGSTPSTPDMVEKVAGTYSTSKGSVTYKEKTYDTCLKMESSTDLKITLAESRLVTFVFKESGKRIEINSTLYTTDTNGWITLTLEKGESHIKKGNGDGINLFAIDFGAASKSNETTTTFTTEAEHSLSADGKTLTITHEHTDTGDKTITVTPAAKATYTLTLENDGAKLSEDYKTITYTVPAANTTKTYKLNVKAEDKTTTDAYTIKIETKAKPGTLAEYTGTFTLADLNTFGSRNGDTKVIYSDDKVLKLEAFAGASGRVEGTKNDGKVDNGAKMQNTSSIKLSANNTEGVKIKKVSIFTSESGRSLTSTPSATADPNASDNKLWEYTFNSVDEAITFANNNSGNIYIYRINVLYETGVADGKTALSAKFSEDVLSWYVNDEKPTKPTLTVTAVGVDNFDAYKVKYTTSNASVVTVNETTGELTVTEGTVGGTAIITAEVTPTADTYVGTSVVYTVTVKPLEVPTVYAHDITVYNTTGVQPQPVVDIYVTDAEGNRVVLDKRYYTLSYTALSGSILENDKDGKFILVGEAGNWTTGSAEVRVTCTPTDEAKKLYHISEADATFKVNVVTAGDKLIPSLGGVTTARMNVSTTREFVKKVLYDGVDITSGFKCTYEIVEQIGVTGSTVSEKSNGTLSFTAGTLTTAGTPGTVTITVTATANDDYSSQYADITEVNNTIVVEVINGNEFKSVEVTPKELNQKVGDVMQDFQVVVKDENGNPIPEDDYTMLWGSSAPGVVAVVGDRSQGIFDAVSAGDATIRVYISKGGYADMKGECIVHVTDPGMFKVTSSTAHTKGTVFDEVDGLTLTLGGWMFKSGVAASHGTTSEELGEGDWGGIATKYKKPLGFTHNIEMGTHKNARQEFGSNCQPESNYIYNAKIEKLDYKLLDPMFNVPCSGSYLAFSPKTTGTVTVYIRQNGVFDNKNADRVYRPQRRVFVVDEMGHFVTSTPKLEYPTTWDNNGLERKPVKYTCDILTDDNLIGTSGRKESSIYELALNKKISDLTNYSPTDEERETVQKWIMGHFEGLHNFSIDPDKFRNGVYASKLPNEITKNQAELKYKDDQAARGWCVLTAAPVSYKFDVKPGKTYYLYNFGSKLGLYGFSFRKGSPTVDEQEWSENSTPDIAKTEDNHVAKVSIDREFKTGIWNACVLPFSMNRQQVNAVFGDCYDKNHLDGTQILYFDRVEGGTIHFVRHAYNTIVAGKPFLIKPSKTDGAIKIASENMGEYPYVTIEATAAEDFGLNKEKADYYWTSSYGAFGVAPGDYFIRDIEINGKQADGNIVRYPKTMTGELNMGGFRGYLTAKTDGLRQSAKSLTIAISDIENDETTYIENVEIADDGTLRQRLSGKVYNLQGQLVSDDASKLYSLPKGIYIVNGTKVSVK